MQVAAQKQRGGQAPLLLQNEERLNSKRHRLIIIGAA
jgi:hypothetical protein